MTDAEKTFNRLEAEGGMALDLTEPGSPDQSYLDRVRQINNSRQLVRETMNELEPEDSEPPTSES
jgi:hypothetical protein